MFRIYAGNDLIYSPTLTNQNLLLIDPELNIELNKASTLKFTVPTINQKAQLLNMMRPEVKVYDGERRVFRGRLITETRDFYFARNVECEGELSYLRDVILPPYTFNGTPAQFYAYLLGVYNNIADSHKRFNIGNCDASGASKEWANNQYPDTWSEIVDKLLNEYGGVLVPRYEIVNGEEVNYLDWLQEPGTQGRQVIQWAKNLLDVETQLSSTPLYTVMIPLGKSTDDERLTIEGVSVTPPTGYTVDGFKIISPLVDTYGRVEYVATYDTIENKTELYNNGLEDLQAAEISSSITIKAIDLSLEDATEQPLIVGNTYRLRSIGHGYDDVIRLQRSEIKLQRPDQSVYYFGAQKIELSKQAVSTRRTASAVARLAAKNSEDTAALKTKLDAITDYVTQRTTNDGWTVERWKSGKVIMSASKEIPGTSTTIPLPITIASYTVQVTSTAAGMTVQSITKTSTALTITTTGAGTVDILIQG